MRLLPLVSWLGCADAVGECATLSALECGSRTDCAVLDGSQITPPAVGAPELCWTVVTSASIGCVDPSAACPAVEAFAQHPDTGECWYFPTGCTPVGWSDCDEAPTDGVCD